MMSQELERKDIQHSLDDLEEQINILQKLLNDPEELSTAQREAVFRQITDVTMQIEATGTRLRGGRSSELLIAGVEQTQATQFFFFNGQGSNFALNNTVPLVSQRDLYLRVYVYHEPLPTNPIRVLVNGRLRYEREASSSDPFPVLKPFNGPIAARPIDSVDRGEFDHTLNFHIPAWHCQGKLRLTVEIFEQPPLLGGPLHADGAERAIADSITVFARFQEVPDFRVRGVLIHYTGAGLDIPAPSGLDFADTFGYVLDTYPIAHVNFGDCVVQEFDGDLTTDVGSGCGPGWRALLDRLADIKAGDGGDPDAIYIGLLPEGVPHGDIVGCGRRDGVTATYVGRGPTLAQEIGHALDRDHAPCGNPPPPIDDKYPIYGSYPKGSIGEFGFDRSHRKIFDPATSEDFMSYCGPRWVSPHTYVALRNAMLERSAAAAASDADGRAKTQEMLYLKFRVHRDGTVELRHSFHRSGRPATARGLPLPVTCELVDSTGRALVAHRCRVRDPHQDIDDPYLDFYETMPWSPTAHSLVFRRDGELLQSVDIEDPAQDLEVTKPTFTAQTVTVEWSARHPQGSLVYLLDFSPDDGRTWRTVATCGGKRRWSVDLSLLPGGDRCRFRVLASSGIRTVSAQTEPFAVPEKPRRAFILAPRPGQVLSPGDLLVLRGGGFSPGLGLSEPQDVLWTSSIDGVLGRGYEIATSDLSEGPHTLTLTVPDGLGGIGSSQLTVLVRAAASSEESPLQIR